MCHECLVSCALWTTRRCVMNRKIVGIVLVGWDLMARDLLLYRMEYMDHRCLNKKGNRVCK